MMNAEEKDELRLATMAVLAANHPVARSPIAIRNRVAMQVNFAVDDFYIRAALEVLRGLGHAEILPDGFTSADYWKATSSGLLTYERSQRRDAPRHD